MHSGSFKENVETVQFCFLRTAPKYRRTNITKENGEEDESMRGTDQHYSQVHPEEEYLEYLRLCKCQHADPGKLCQCNARQNL